MKQIATLWMILVPMMFAIVMCDRPPAKATAPLPALTDVQVDWMRECAKHSHGNEASAAHVVWECKRRARILW